MIEYNLYHVNGLFFEIKGDEGKNREYDVSFIERETNKTIYETKLKVGMWAKLERKYLSDLMVVIRFQGRTIKQINLLDEIKGKRVFISFESKSLGDTLAWIPCCEYFRQFYGCEVIVSTFMNELFIEQYPKIQFVGRGVGVKNISGMFELGWFYDKNKEPINPVTISLQQAANNILHLPETSELICNISHDRKNERPIKEKYVCISTQSTAQLKLWYYWQDLINWINSQGYKVLEVSKDPTELEGLEIIEDKSLKNVMNYLYHAEYFIGLSSGISWLAWALRKRVYMIANFSDPTHEFQSNCIRITNKSVCNGCWNNPKFKFDKSNWLYCPEHEDTPRKFECHKSISVEDVILSIELNQPKNIF